MEQKKHKIIFVLGGPGSGKGTQCENMVNEFNFTHFSTGDLLRSEVKSGSDLGKEINSYISQGNLVPGDVAVSLIKKSILAESKENLFIIDGFPRNQSNIDSWEKVVGDSIEVLGCIYLECSDEIMKERILKRAELENRSDDNEEVFTNRVKIYHEKTVPILDYFKEKDNLLTVSAEGTKEECFEEIKKIIQKMNIENELKVLGMKKFLKKRVDPFLKPLIVHLMQEQPEDIQEAIIQWMKNEGTAIKDQISQNQ